MLLVVLVQDADSLADPWSFDMTQTMVNLTCHGMAYTLKSKRVIFQTNVASV